MILGLGNTIPSDSVRQGLGGGGGGFDNTYSLAFDGVDDFMSYSNSWFAPSTPSQSTGNSVGSFSCWFKASNWNISPFDLKGILSFNVGSNAKPLLWVIYRGNNVPGGRYLRFYFRGSDGAGGTTGAEQFFVYDNASTTYGGSGISFEDDTWYHLALVFDKDATNRVTVYVNGNQFLIPNTTTGSGSAGTRTISSIGLPYSLPYNPLSTGITPKCDIACVRIGPTTVTYNSPINLDELSLYDYALTFANVTSIYNSGVPNDVSSLNQIDWYRMGDNGSYKSPQWLIPENSNKDKVSNYSFDFDGVDDIISMGDVLDFDYNQPFTISAWINLEAFSYSFAGVVSKQDASGNFRGYFLHIDETSGVYNLKFILGNTLSNRIRIQGTTDLLGLGWTHIACTYDGSTNASGTKLYINGSLETLNAGLTQDTLGSNTTLNSASFNIGSRGGSRFFEGNIDEVSVFNSELSSTDINSLYGGGTPSTITGAVAHYKMGEEANFTDNWLVNNSALSNYSTRSFNFDGVDDYIETTKTAALTTASLSMWVKVSGNFGVNERQSLASNDDFNHGRDFIIADTPTTTNDAYIAMFAGAIIYGKTSATGGIPINDGNWHHLVWTYDGSAGTSAAINMYVDGQNQYSNSTYSSFWSYEIKFQYFGKPVAANTYFDGSMDEVAYFNSILSESDVTSIYNSGVPADLSSYSPISWWRMGEDATFSTNWSLPDNGSASNTGTSANMTIADLEGDAPNYTGGGLSANMTIEDRVGDAPNSTSNALSYNMTESDRETDVPT